MSKSKSKQSVEDVQIVASAIELLRRGMPLGEFARFKAIHTDQRLTLRKGETIRSVWNEMTARVEALLPKVLAERVLDNDFDQDDWERAFDAVDVAGAIDGR